MRLAEVAPETRERLGKVRWDRIIEKHEGPWDWDGWLEDAEFQNVEGYDVLLPVDEEQRGNITFLRCVPSADGNSLTIFLTDTTFYGDDPFLCGYLAVCERFPGEPWYVAIVYHEWFASATLTLDDI